MWKIYYCIYSPDGKLEKMNRYPKEYKRRGYAERIARKFMESNSRGRMCGHIVSETNPFSKMSFAEYSDAIDRGRKICAASPLARAMIKTLNNKG